MRIGLQEDVRGSTSRARGGFLKHAPAESDEREYRHDLNTYNHCAQQRSHPAMLQIFDDKPVDHLLSVRCLGLASQKLLHDERRGLVIDVYSTIESAHGVLANAARQHRQSPFHAGILL